MLKVIFLITVFPISYLEKQFSAILKLAVVTHKLDCNYSLFSS